MSVLRITPRCNERCLFCNIRPDDPHNIFHETPEAVERFLDSYDRNQGNLIEISGGEPTLNPHLPEIIRLIRKRGLNTMLETNATLLANKRLVSSLVQADLEEAFVSLHAANAELSDKITGMPGAFEKSIQGIENLLQTNIEVVINFVWCRENLEHLPEFARFLYQRFGRSAALNISVMAPNFGRDDIEHSFRFSEGDPFLRETVRICEELRLSVRIPDICGQPLCTLRGIEWIYIYPLKLFPHYPEEAASSKRKGPQCKRCIYDPICVGVWNEYARKYGTDELHPVTSGNPALIKLLGLILSPAARATLRSEIRRGYWIIRRYLRQLL